MSMIPFLDLGAVNARDRQAIIDAMVRVLDSGWYVLGGEVRQFEKAFAHYCGVPHVVGVANGLDALTLIFRASRELGRLNAGDEIIVPSNTYIATILAVSANDLVPVLVEPDPVTFNIDAQRLPAAITARTRGLLLVDLYGRLAWSCEIQRVADAAAIPIYVDAAQSHGAQLDGRRAGSFGLATGFSFYPGKNLGALGDAGAVATGDGELADAIRAIANYGSHQKYHNRYRGVNSRLDELQAAILSAKLPRLDEDNARRAGIAQRYLTEIRHDAIVLPDAGSPEANVWHLFVVRTEAREALRRHLERNNVQTLVHYPIPPHHQPAYAEWSARSYPIAETIYRTVLSLPMDPTLSAKSVTTIIDACNSFDP
jgi:dTDP-4-amino-4,6-dideoxygalactose transaminase